MSILYFFTFFFGCQTYKKNFQCGLQAMKLDPDIPIVQNEAAIMVTMAAELFLRNLAKESQQIAKSRGRNTIR